MSSKRTLLQGLRTPLICILVAIIINFGIAWWIAWKSEPFARDLIVRTDGRIEHGRLEWRCSIMRSGGTRMLYAECGPPLEGWFASRGRVGPHQFRDVSPHWIRNKVVDWWGDIDAPKPPAGALVVAGRGWPLLALHCVRKNQMGMEQLKFEGALNVRRGATQEWVALPFRPIWPGFGVNVVLYAAVCWIFLTNMKIIRQWARYRHGRCPQCGYDLRGRFDEGCSECGWRRSGSITEHHGRLERRR